MPNPDAKPTAGPGGDQAAHGDAHEVHGSDFRDRLATADQEGNRRWLFPKKPSGRFYRARTWLSYLLLAIMFTGPFIRIQGNPLLMLNIVDRKFVVLGQIFWPQDTIIFAIAMLLFLTGILVFTAAFGRLWCGWTCPQTLLMEMVFRKLEYWIEGDSHEQRVLDSAPWGGRKVVKRIAKHAIFFGLSFIIGNTLLSYIIGVDALKRIIVDDPLKHLQGLMFMSAFTVIFYLIFARFREQACTFICPYGRLQSVLLDESTLIVAYDHKRGESRGKLHRDQGLVERRATGTGDCIDCHQCVSVCPTGIDIRNGTQMECVHCTACIDACDSVMDKVGMPRGLVRYASANGIEHGERLRFTPRMIGYLAILALLGVLLLLLVFTRSDVQTTLLRAPGALYHKSGEGRISNLYTLKLVNKTSHEVPIELRLEGREGNIRVMGSVTVVPAGLLTEDSVLIDLDPKTLNGPTARLVIGVYSNGKLMDRIKTVFVGPRDGALGDGK